MKVLMLFPKYPEQTIYNLNEVARTVQGRKACMAPLGLLTIAAFFPEDFELRLVDRNVREESEADWTWADVVVISLMLVQQEDYRVCICNARRHGRPVAVGGPYTRSSPTTVMSEADWVCYGEAETIMEEFISDLRADRRGKQYHGGYSADMLSLPSPRYSLLDNINDYYVMPVQTSRGCPFNCEFCDVIEIFGRVPRFKSPEQVVNELETMYQLGFDGSVIFVDDNFIGLKKNARKTLDAMIEWNTRRRIPYQYYTQISVDLADDIDFLDAMARANFLVVFLGIETPDPVLMRGAKKYHNTRRDTMDVIRTVREHGILVEAGILFGFDGERRGIFERNLAFIAESGIGTLTASFLHALPNTQLSRRLQREGRLLASQPANSNTSVEGINFIPKGEVTKREYIQGMATVYRSIYEPKAYFRRIVPAHLSLHRQVKPPLRLAQLKAVLRLCYFLGVRDSSTRWLFWKALGTVIRKNPTALVTFFCDCMHYHHLHKHADYVYETLTGYLENPDPDDVLDSLVTLEPGSDEARQPDPDPGTACNDVLEHAG